MTNYKRNSFDMKIIARMIDKSNIKIFLSYALVFTVCAVGFTLAPIQYDDWRTYRNVALGVWPMYQHSGYYNPPYVAWLLLPIALLPETIGFGVLAAASVTTLFYLCVKQGLSVYRCALLLLSPPMLYTLLHGQIDVLILAAAVFAPPVLRPFVALAKPQCAVGLLLPTPRSVWGLAAVLWLVVYVVASMLVGWAWPLELLLAMRGASAVGWNVSRPFMLPLGLWLLAESYRRNVDDYALAASPLLLPYAAPSSFIVPLFFGIQRMPLAACVAVWCASWLGVLL